MALSNQLIHVGPTSITWIMVDNPKQWQMDFMLLRRWEFQPMEDDYSKLTPKIRRRLCMGMLTSHAIHPDLNLQFWDRRSGCFFVSHPFSKYPEGF